MPKPVILCLDDESVVLNRKPGWKKNLLKP